MPANKEIAKILGISESTLSNIVNNRPGTSPKTKARVIEALKENGWESILKSGPSAPAASSASVPLYTPSDELDSTENPPAGSGKEIAFLIFKRDGKVLGESSFADLIQENVQKQVHRLGYELNVLYIALNKDIDYQINRLREMNLAGILIFATEMHDDDTLLFKNFGIPIVSIDNDFTHLENPLPSVIVNNKPGSYQALKYLIENGHTKIGYVHADIPIYPFANRRHRYESAFEYYKLPFPVEFYYKLRYSQFACFNDFSKILESHPEDLPTAIVADDDIMAAGVMMALKMHGYRVPEDMSIIGFSGRPLCNEVVPTLATVSINKDQMAIESVSKLYSMIMSFEDYPEMKKLYTSPSSLSAEEYASLADTYRELILSHCSVTGVGTKLIPGDSVKDISEKS